MVEGDIAKIKLKDREGKVIYSLVDTEDLQKLIDLGYKWYARYHRHIDNYYVQCNQYIGGKHKVVALHRFVMNYPDGTVDHINPENTLDNRKCNLRVVKDANNSSNRRGANKNSKTGVRNVHLVNRYGDKQVYLVQIMKKGMLYKWEFPLDQFEEACKFAEEKRKELFGKYAGNN